MVADLPDEVILRLMAFSDPRDLMIVCSRWRNIILLSPLVSFTKKLARIRVLSNRRNKGLLWVGKDPVGSLNVVRTLNLAFFNSGASDGVPSSILREICLLKHISHPNIVAPRDAEFHGLGALSIVFPYHDRSLRDILSVHDSVPLRRATNIFEQLCRGLAYLHRLGIIHRNVRPENILMDDLSQTVKLADFSACRRMHRPFSLPGSATPEEPKNRTRTAKERQRLAYRAPELLMRCHDYSSEVDMWSAGVVLLELLLGGHPLPWAAAGVSEAETLLAVFEVVGSPTVERWPEGPLRCRMWSARLPKWPGIFSQTFDSLPSGSAVLNAALIQGGQGIFSTLKNLLTFPPESRASAASLLTTPPEVPAVRDPAGPRKLSPAWVAWMFGVGKILDAPSWCVWAAVRTAEAFFSKSAPGADAKLYLAAALKLSQRLEVSRDYFRLNTCERLAAALPGATVDGLIQAEKKLLCDLCFSVEIPDKPEKLKDPLELFICDIALVLDLPCRWEVVLALAPTVAAAWKGQHIPPCEADFSVFEMQTALRAILGGLADFRRILKNTEDLEVFHEDLILPPLPSPAWPLDAMTASLRSVEPGSPSTPVLTRRSEGKRSLTDPRRRRTLSADRRKRRRLTNSEAVPKN